MFNLSAAMANAFADAVRTMKERALELGPNPLRVDGLRSDKNVE